MEYSLLRRSRVPGRVLVGSIDALPRLIAAEVATTPGRGLRVGVDPGSIRFGCRGTL